MTETSRYPLLNIANCLECGREYCMNCSKAEHRGVYCSVLCETGEWEAECDTTTKI